MSPPFEILRPTAGLETGLVFASPHSGSDYSAEFLESSRLDPETLRKSEDCFVDELFAATPGYGAPLIKALFPRAFIDVNREAYELDPAMFDEPLPAHANVASPRVAGGLGTIAKVVSDGHEIYRGLLSFAEVEQRIETLYKPYHAALAALLDASRERYGAAVLIDCHSMPSVGGPMDQDRGRPRADFILGDRYGTSCGGHLVRIVRRELEGRGYRVGMNAPYAGGYCTAHYGRPGLHLHALQIEINRALYMDETRYRKTARFEQIRTDLTGLIRTLTGMALKDLIRA